MTRFCDSAGWASLTVKMSSLEIRISVENRGKSISAKDVVIALNYYGNDI
jgi:hypothetical protein